MDRSRGRTRRLDLPKNVQVTLSGQERWRAGGQEGVGSGLARPSPGSGSPGRGASSYLLLLEVQQIRRAHLAVTVCARRRVPARAASGSARSPGPAAAAAIGLPREAAHAVLTRRS